ncbi:MAG: hypothetical protein KTR26_22055 [Flammeovirgaceae bacterium]|nr:hypothetical protein [Flammeovirgaceae bacterium]
MKKILTFLIIGGMFAFVTVKSISRKFKTDKATKEVFVKKSETLNAQSSTTNKFISPASTKIKASQIEEIIYSPEIQEASFGK